MSLTEIETNVTIDLVNLVYSLDREQLKKLVVTMCEVELDLDFEKELVRLIVANIKTELTNSWDGSVDPEFKQFIKSLKKV